MPIIWIGFSTNSSDDVHLRRNQPGNLEAYVKWVVENSVPDDAPVRPSLDDFYIEVGGDRACAVVSDLDDYVALKVVTRKLGADEIRKFLPVDKAEEAIDRLRNFPTQGKPPADAQPTPDEV